MRTSSADDQASRAGPSTLNVWFLCPHCGLDSVGPFLFWSQMLRQCPTERFSPKIHPLLGAFQFPKETSTFLHISHPLGKVQTHQLLSPLLCFGTKGTAAALWAASSRGPRGAAVLCVGEAVGEKKTLAGSC